MNPSLQEHENEPFVFVQFAFSSQVWLPDLHLSMSTVEKWKDYRKMDFFIFYIIILTKFGLNISSLLRNKRVKNITGRERGNILSTTLH